MQFMYMRQSNNELGWHLFMVRQAAEFLQIHPEFTSHLDLHIGEAVFFLCFDPYLELVAQMEASL